LLQQVGIVCGPYLGREPRRGCGCLLFEDLDVLLRLYVGRLGLPQLGLEVVQSAHGHVFFQLRGNHSTFAAEFNQLLLGAGEACVIFLGLILKDWAV